MVCFGLSWKREVKTDVVDERLLQLPLGSALYSLDHVSLSSHSGREEEKKDEVKSKLRGPRVEFPFDRVEMKRVTVYSSLDTNEKLLESIHKPLSSNHSTQSTSRAHRFNLDEARRPRCTKLFRDEEDR